MEIDYDELEKRWLGLVKAEPERAYEVGPPNWLVKQDWKGLDKEEFLEAHRRVKARYFPRGDPRLSPVVASVATKNVASSGDMSPVTERVVATEELLCETCGVRSKQLGRSMCAGCRKKAERLRRNGTG